VAIPFADDRAASGTSLATPEVAGTVAVMPQKPTLTIE
jgi:hypothetical protein